MAQTAFKQPDGTVKWKNYQDLPGSSGERKLKDRQKFIESDFKDATVLDLGCWGGQTMLEAKRLGAKKVIGVEIDREAIEKGRAEDNNIFRDNLENHFFWKELPKFDIILCLSILGNMKNKVAVLSNSAQVADIMYIEGHGSQHKFTRADWTDLFLTYTNYKTIEYLGAVTTRPFFRLAREEKTIDYILGKNYKRIALIGKPGAGKTYYTQFFKGYKIYSDNKSSFAEKGVTGDKIVVDNHGALELSEFDCVINIVSEREKRVERIISRIGSKKSNKKIIDFSDTISPLFKKGNYDFFTITNN